MKKNIVLITILSVLVLVKFVLVPVFDWQNNKMEQITQLERKIKKSKDYIVRLPEMTAQQEQLTTVINTYKEQTDTYNDIGRYKLNKQRQLEALFSQYNVEIKALNWRDEVSTEQGISIPMYLQFTGQLKSFINLKLDILASGSNIELEKFNLNIAGQLEKSLGRVNGNLTIVFSPTESLNAIN
jgi:uncharacterized membrane protein YcgQ (UPF0703/DUF1980 family)